MFECERAEVVRGIGGEPVPAGLFRPEGGEVRQISDDVDLGDVEPAAWGITIEPAGGSEAPTSEILYYGESTT